MQLLIVPRIQYRNYFCFAFFVRCMQPIQQHGRRTPSNNSVITLSTCFFLVSSVLTFIVQQIHSLRASGVRSSHLSRADSSFVNALRKSAGTSCTTPSEIFLLGTLFMIPNQLFKNLFISPAKSQKCLEGDFQPA